MRDILIKNNVLMVANSIDYQAGGLTQAILNRAKSFDSAGINTSILTFNDDVKSRDSYNELIKLGRIRDSIGWLNVYEYYRQKNTSPKETLGRKIRQLIKYSILDNLSIIKITHDTRPEGGKLRVDYHKRHLLTKKKIFSQDGRLSYVTYFNKLNQPTHRKVYNESGYLQRLVRLKPRTGDVVDEMRYTSDGFCYMRRIRVNDEWRFELHNRSGRRVFYESVDEFRTAWLNEVASQQTIKPIFIFDSPDMGKASLHMDASVAYRIVMLHGYQHDDTEPRAADLRLHLLRNLKKIERMVVLTERQRRDIIEEFGSFNNVTVIPNSARPTTLKRKVKKDTKRITLIARLAPQKQVDHALKVFSRVIAEIPDAKLDIYGQGEGLADSKKLIADLKLADNVQLKGYVQAKDIDYVYATSLACIMTSKYEGLPLSILEAMMNGTSYVCYDLKYGPSDVITDGKTGYIIPQGDIEAMADKLIWLLKNPQEAIMAGRKAKQEVLQKYSEDVVLKQWLKLLKRRIGQDKQQLI